MAPYPIPAAAKRPKPPSIGTPTGPDGAADGGGGGAACDIAKVTNTNTNKLDNNILINERFMAVYLMMIFWEKIPFGVSTLTM